jgi:hypothetical protein
MNADKTKIAYPRLSAFICGHLFFSQGLAVGAAG